jgi:hypothetical protein
VRACRRWNAASMSGLPVAYSLLPFASALSLKFKIRTSTHLRFRDGGLHGLIACSLPLYAQA